MFRLDGILGRMSVDPAYKVARSGARSAETRWKDRTVIDGILGIDVSKNTLDVSISSSTKRCDEHVTQCEGRGHRLIAAESQPTA
jgi:hypothetical protein